VGIVVRVAGFDQPIVLLVISAVVGSFMMCICSGLLILINRRILPGPIRTRGVRLGAMIWSILLFGTLSFLTFRDQLGKLVG
jgi:vacuolar-type H+-ATPase subunit I/STV1